MSTANPNDSAPQLGGAGPFICDQCGVFIENAQHAWGEWYGEPSTTQSRKARHWRFSITHGPAHSPLCELPAIDGVSRGSEKLDRLLSADGFSYLLEFLVETEVDSTEFAKFLMRLYVPGYEQAHRYVGAAKADGVFEAKGNEAFLSQSEIAGILEALDEGRFNTYM